MLQGRGALRGHSDTKLFRPKIWMFHGKSISLPTKYNISMATYTITINERTASGKALMAYLKALGVLIEKVTPKAKSSYERSQEDIRKGRIEKFSSSEDMFESLGI